MMLELVNVAKVYKGGTRGVDGVTMRLGAGLVGLLGPNGAGKSSLMRSAATVTRPTSGQVLFDGTDAVARPDLLRRNLGYLPQDFGVYPHLTAREFLSYLAAVKGMPARLARVWIQRNGWCSGTCSATWPATVWCCCPRTSSPMSSRWPPTSRSWPAAGSGCAAARRICCARPKDGC